jgi:hypothetical protein
MAVDKKGGQGKRESKQKDVSAQSMHEQVNLKCCFSYFFPNQILVSLYPPKVFTVGSILKSALLVKM